jgi:hypothetical protein
VHVCIYSTSDIMLEQGFEHNHAILEQLNGRPTRHI